MSNVVDDRVVNMRFDNSNFEKNVSTSIGTLDKLKRSLDFSKSQKSLESLQYASKSFNMGGVADAIMAIQDRFSTMGIVGMTIIQKLTGSALDAIGNVASKITSKIINGGISRAMNIETAKFQLEGMGVKYGEVFDAIDYAVTNTAYGLDAAAQAASQLATAGLDYKNVIFTHKADNKELTQMSMALRAVSGVAAQTQSDYSRVAEYFQLVATQSAVTGEAVTRMTQVLGLPIKENLAEGLNAIAKGSMEASDSVQKAVKNIVKGAEITSADIDKLVKDKAISFDMFATIMFGKFADHAVEANRTILGVTANIGAALAKIGAEFISPLIAIDGTIVKLFESVRKKINAIKPLIIPFATSVTDSIKRIAEIVKGTIVDKADLTWIKPFFTGLGKIVEALANDLIKVQQAFKAVFPSDVTKKLKSFSEAFEKFGTNFLNREKSFEHTEIIVDRFKGLFSVLSMLKTILGVILSPLKGFIQGIRDLIPASGDTLKSFTDWAKNADQMLKSSEKLKEFSNRLSEIGRSLGRLVMSIPSYFKDSIAALKDGPEAFFNSLFDSEEGFINRLGKDLIYIVETLSGTDLSNVYDIWDSICNFFNKLFVKLSEVFSKITELVKKFVDKVKGNIGGESSKDSVLGGFAEKLNKDTKPLESVFDFVKTVLSGLFSFLNGMVPIVKGLFKTIVVPIADFVKSIFESLQNDENFDKSLKNTTLAVVLFQLKNIFIQINKLLGNNPLKGFKDFFSQIKDTAMAAEKNFNANYWLKIAGSILLIAFAMKMIADIPKDRIGDATGVVMVLVGTLVKVGQMLASESEMVLNNKWMQKAVSTSFPSFIALAAAVLILANAVKKIADIPEDKLLNATLVVEILLTTMAVIAKVLASDSNTILDNKWMQKAVNNSFPNFIALAASIWILAQAVKKISEIEEDKLLNATLVVEILLTTMAVIAKVLSSSPADSKKSKGMGALAMIGMATSVLILAKAVEQIAEIKEDKLLNAMLVVEILLTTMAIITKLLSMDSSMDPTKMISIGVAMIAIAASMKIFASAASDFAGLDWTELGKAGAAMATIVGMVILLTKLTQSTSGFAMSPDGLFGGASQAKNMIEIGVGLIAMATAMKIFASAAKSFAELDWTELGKAGAAIAGILVSLGAFSHFVDGKNLLILSAAMVVFATSLLILVPAIEAFGHLKITQVATALLTMAGILVILGVAAKATQSIQLAMLGLAGVLLVFGLALASVGAGLLLFTAGVTAAAGSISLVVDFIIELIRSVVVGLVEVIGEAAPLIVETLLSLVESVLHSLEDHVPEMVDTLLSIIIKIINAITERVPELVDALRNLVGGIVEALSLSLEDFDPEAFTAAMVGLSAFLVALGVAATLCQQAMLGVLAIMAVMAVVVLLFATLSTLGYESNQILEISQGLSMILVSLAATMAIISLIPIPAAAMGVAGLAIVVGGIAAILAILGGLAQIPGFEWLLGEGKRILVQIGEAIGEFVGSIIGGLGVGLTNHLPKIADNLSQFAVRLVPFIATMKLIDLQVVAAAGSLVGIIMALTAADVINGLTSWFTGGNSVGKFGEQIAELAPHLRKFSEEVKDIDADGMKKAAEAGKAVAEMAKALPNEGGVAAFFAGENDMEKFGEKLVSFGKSLVAYAEAIADLDVEAVDKSAAAGKMVAEMAAMMPNTGGVAGFFAGENDIDDFGYKLERFGKSLTQYSKNVADLDTEAVEKSKAAGQVMIDLAATVPNTGGAVSWFTGNNDLDVFGEQLVAFGGFITEYANEVADLNIDAVKASSAAGQIMVDLEAQLKNSGGAVSWFTGDDSLKSFGHNLQSFGESIVAFSDTLSGATNLQEGLAMIDGLIPAVEGMIGLANALVDTDGTGLTRFARSAKGFVTALSQIGGMYVDEFIKEFTDAVEKVEEGIATFVSYITTGLLNRINEMTTMGQKYVRYFIAGMGSKMVDVKNKGADVGKAAVTGLQSVYPAFYNVGVNCILGIINGLNDAEAVKKLAARLNEIAALMISSLGGPLKIESPSKVFMQLGRYTVEGLVIGIRDETGEVVKATEDLADATIDNMQTIIDQVRESIDDNMDLVPTITPIVDLSNVTKGASTVNDLFNKSVISGNIRANSSVVRSDINLDENLQNEQLNGSRFGTTFIQNNYSPKALNRIEIYRQTRNQFAQYREAMQ